MRENKVIGGKYGNVLLITTFRAKRQRGEHFLSEIPCQFLSVVDRVMLCNLVISCTIVPRLQIRDQIWEMRFLLG